MERKEEVINLDLDSNQKRKIGTLHIPRPISLTVRVYIIKRKVRINRKAMVLII